MIETQDADLGAGARAAFFTCAGGVSTGIYDSLQVGWGAKADTRERVAENRRRAAAHFGAPTLVTAYQVHSARAVIIDAPFADGAAPEADALVTATPGLMLGVLTADCAPVLFYDAGARVIGGAHAGWKGALGGVLEATLTAMQSLGARPERIRAAIGPCISGANYQVDDAFRARFTDAEAAAARFFGPDPAAGRWRFDLPGYVAARLAAAGVGHVVPAQACTYAEETRFFSNRRAFHRGEGDYGRGLSAIMLI